ncbi:MAG: cbb3-type cytochrome oxidase assembly protein CcoS [Candidatus Thermoplasmatota archaeon]|mgnify:FL=1|nr:cbb3-type cytochrome oxidase assembly protein CcoS [Candidatus Thermoplasmatota archaeon]
MSGIMGFLFLLSGIFVLLIIVGVFWSIKSGQFDDLEGPAERILMDDDDPLLPGRRLSGKDEHPLEHKYPKGHE